jgi:hypothetical protein
MGDRQERQMIPTYFLNRGDRSRARVLGNVLAVIQSLPDSKSWRIDIKVSRPERTLQQNKTAFGLAYKRIMEAVGLEGEKEKNQLHTNFCGDFFGWVHKPLVGRVPIRTTTKNEAGEDDVLDRYEMGRFYDFIVRRAAEYEIVIPEPNPFWREMENAA